MTINNHRPSNIEKRWRTLHSALINPDTTPEITIDFKVLQKWGKMIERHRAELVSSRFSNLSVKMFHKMMLGLTEVNAQVYAILDSNEPKNYGKELSEAMSLTIRMGYLLMVYGMGKGLENLCLSYMAFFDERLLTSEISESYNYERVNFHRMMYSEVKAGRMPLEFVDAYLGLRYTDPNKNYENLHYYYDMMKRIISENNIAQQDMFLIWGSLKCKNPEDFVKLAKRPVSFPPLFELTDLEWKLNFAFALYTNTDYEASEKLASDILREYKDVNEKTFQHYKPQLLKILSKRDPDNIKANESKELLQKNLDIRNVNKSTITKSGERENKDFLFNGQLFVGRLTGQILPTESLSIDQSVIERITSSDGKENLIQLLKKIAIQSTTVSLAVKHHTWSDITTIELINEGGQVRAVKHPLMLIIFNNGDSNEVHLPPSLFSFLWFLIEQHTSGENWLARIDEPEICDKIDQIWEKVYDETFTDRVLEYLDGNSPIYNLPDEGKLRGILKSFDSRTAITTRHKGAWVIDPADKRRKGHIFHIREALKKSILNNTIPEDLFQSGKKHGTKWLGLYQLNPPRVSHINFITPEILQTPK